MSPLNSKQRISEETQFDSIQKLWEKIEKLEAEGEQKRLALTESGDALNVANAEIERIAD